MAQAEQPHLRIYCVCGQKMKVTESLFGRPGKCIACRQKIRIPKLDEVPEGETEIYLKDHPEFLRKTSIRRKKSTPKDRTEAIDKVRTREVVYRKRKEGETPDDIVPEEDQVELGESRPATVALDILEPMRELSSLDARISRELEARRDGNRAQDQARGYHSTAVLLVDGTVLSAGGGLGGDPCDGNEGPGECQDAASHIAAPLREPHSVRNQSQLGVFINESLEGGFYYFYYRIRHASPGLLSAIPWGGRMAILPDWAQRPKSAS